MRRDLRTCILLTISITAACHAQKIENIELKSLYETRQWVPLYEALQKSTTGPPLYKGAVGTVFNDDRRAEEALRSVLTSAPHSKEAYEAYEWLAHIYFRTGQYRELISDMEARWAAFPSKKDIKSEQAALAGFRGLPNQIVIKRAYSTLQHDPGTTFIPISINGRSANYFLDTGAWINSMSESEAKRLGLTVHGAVGTLNTSDGSAVGFRTTVVSQLVVGGVHFDNVSFAVFHDNEEPWSTLPPGRRGLLGIPVLLGFRTLIWNTSGMVEIGSQSAPADPRQANLYFEDDHLAISATLRGRPVLATLDTGAETTDLYEPFAQAFPKLISDAGRQGKTEVRGVGHAEIFKSVTLPELTFRISQTEVVLRPAHVLRESIGAKCCLGNFGMDLLKQARAFKVDFSAMKLDLQPRQ